MMGKKERSSACLTPRSVITYRVSVESKVSVGKCQLASPVSRAWLLHDPYLDLLHSCAAHKLSYLVRMILTLCR